MSLDTLIHDLNQLSPYWGLYASGAAVGGMIIGYALGRKNTKRAETFGQGLDTRAEQSTEDESEEYKKRTISQAMLPDTDSRIKGVVTEFHPSLSGYSGIICDGNNSAPFYLDTDNISSSPEEGLVPILLNHSKTFKTSILLDVEFDQEVGIFNVRNLLATMEGRNYRI